MPRNSVASLLSDLKKGKTYFISDCHLGGRYIADRRAHEARVVRFLDHIKDDAAALFLVGDILDYWYEYRNVVPRGYVRFLGKLAQLADAGVRITWVTGNHDVWLFDYLRDEVGLTVQRQAAIVDVEGTPFLISHGDDVGRQSPRYRFMKWCFTSRLCQWLYASVHPRWTYMIAVGWSTNNRIKRSAEDEEREKIPAADELVRYVRQHHAQNPDVKHYVFGHLHLARIDQVDDAQVVFLGDWIKQDTYAVFDGNQLTLHHFPVDIPT